MACEVAAGDLGEDEPLNDTSDEFPGPAPGREHAGTPDRPDPGGHRAAHRAPWLLLVGAALGLALAMAGLLERRADERRLPPDAVARVGDRTIRRVDYERVLAGVATDRRGPVDASVRRRVLDRMIDEELLVQRALELGLAAIDRRVRGELTASLMTSIVSEADADEPSEDEVEAHFEANVDFFSRPGRLQARTIFFSSRPAARPPEESAGEREVWPGEGGAAERATFALDRLHAGERFEEIARRLGDAQISPLPNAMLPPGKIRDYVGPKVLRELEGLEVGRWSEPIETAGGWILAQLVDRETRLVPRFEDVEALVRQDLKRRRGDEALRRYLDDLRDGTVVSVDDAVFESKDSLAGIDPADASGPAPSAN